MTDNPVGTPRTTRSGTPRWVTGAGVAAAASALLMAGLLWAPPPAAAATAPVGLGTAEPFSVLGGQTVTNTGPSILGGDLGVSPGTAITGFPPGLVSGSTHSADAVALQAQSDLTTAYNDAAGRAPTGPIAGDLGGLTLTDGVYNASSSIGLTGTLTLDGAGDPDSVFIFQVGTALTTASASTVSLINGADACNVYWQIGSSATLGTGSTFVGTILALTSITVTTGTTVEGRALARNGSVTLDTNVFTTADCAAAPTTTPTTTTTTTTTATTTTTTGPTSTAAPTTTTTTTVSGSVGPSSSGSNGAPRPRPPYLAGTGPGTALSPLLSVGGLLLIAGGLLYLVGRVRRQHR